MFFFWLFLLSHRCELQIDPAAPKKGLVHRIINKARHPRHKHCHDELLGDLVLCEAGREAVVDKCSGSWLSQLTWEKVSVWLA
jgi:hypothetical protein